MTDVRTPVPDRVRIAQDRADEVDFHMSSVPGTGLLLRTLAASKPGGRLLELGTGTGVGAAWLLDGMSADARLITIESHPEAAGISREVLAGDDRVEVVHADARQWVQEYAGPPFDLIFVDVGVLKYERRALTLSLLAPGGLFVADDLLPQPKWVDGHAARVAAFRREIWGEPDLAVTLLDCASGLVIAARTGARAA